MGIKVMVKKYIYVFFIVIIFLIGCYNNNNEKSIELMHKSNDRDYKDNENETVNINTSSDYKNEQYIESLFGNWKIERVVLHTDGFEGEYNHDGRKFYASSYIGSELEYTKEYFRLNGENFNHPEYKVLDFTVDDYNNNGDFIEPDLYDLIENESIIIYDMEKYANIDEVVMKYIIVDIKQEYYGQYFIPIGLQIILLNDDTMLIGVWGDVLLARKLNS